MLPAHSGGTFWSVGGAEGPLSILEEPREVEVLAAGGQRLDGVDAVPRPAQVGLVVGGIGPVAFDAEQEGLETLRAGLGEEADALFSAGIARFVTEVEPAST